MSDFGSSVNLFDKFNNEVLGDNQEEEREGDVKKLRKPGKFCLPWATFLKFS